MRHTMHHNMHDIMHYTVMHAVGTLGNSASKTMRLRRILGHKGNNIEAK